MQCVISKQLGESAKSLLLRSWLKSALSLMQRMSPCPLSKRERSYGQGLSQWWVPCLLLLCMVGGYPQELQFPDSFAVGLLTSVSQWEAVGEPKYFSPLCTLGCSLAVAAFPWSQQTLSTGMVVASCIADVWVAICLFSSPNTLVSSSSQCWNPSFEWPDVDSIFLSETCILKQNFFLGGKIKHTAWIKKYPLVIKPRQQNFRGEIKCSPTPSPWLMGLQFSQIDLFGRATKQSR